MRKACCLAFMRLLGRSVSCDYLSSAGALSQTKLTPTTDAFIRDELSKGRYDPAISKVCFEMLLELFGRTLKLDLGDHDGKEVKVDDVC
jgi:hypothetical protein